MKTILPACVVLLLHVSPAFAWQQSTSDTTDVQVDYVLQPVEITATRYIRDILDVPYAVDRVGRNEIQLGEPGLSLEESVRSLPGIIVHNRNNVSQGDRISIRGLGSRASFGVRGVKVVLDGIPLTMADGQSQLNNLDLTSAGQIEVLRGPSSSLYGNAAGGVIQIRTEGSPDTPLEVTPRFITGSHGLRRIQGKAAGSSGDYRFLVNYNTLWFDGFRDHAFARSTGINSIGKRMIGETWTVTTVANYYNAPYQYNPSSLDKATAESDPASARAFVQRQGASKKVRQVQGGLSLRYEAPGSQGEITVFGMGRTLFNPIPGRIIDLDRMAGGIRGVYSREGRIGNSGFRMTAGVDLEIQRDERREFGNGGIPGDLVGTLDDARVFDEISRGDKRLDQDEGVDGLGPFVELEWSPGPDISVTAGGRYDRFRYEAADRFLKDQTDDSGTRNMAQFSPHLGLAFRPAPLTAVYGNFSTAFQTPTTTELSNQPTQAGGFNPNLEPERLRGFEAGVKGFLPDAGLAYDAALFAFGIRNMLQPFQVDDPETDEIFYRNAGETSNRGIELKVTWSPRPGFDLSLAYTGMQFEFSNFEVEREVDGSTRRYQLSGNEVPGVPPHHLFAGLAYAHPGTGSFVELNAQWTAEYFANDFNGPAPGSEKPESDFVNDGYGLVDFRMGIEYNSDGVGGILFAGVNNLFDARYNGSVVPNAFGDRFFEPAAGRTWYIGLGLPVGVGSR
ncbi:MAG: TonB-dependent receptor [Gemmatimonadetes bacterium]|nr:TonB-dependent receptor [Gemmatimonadota bacterium]